jgi:GNAT superfamily N-acetyltransferase
MSNPIRTLLLSDVPSAMELSTGAGWNQTAEDWHRVIQLSTNGCRCIEDAGKIVATTTLLHHGTALAWIGMVLTRPEYRRQGLAKRLMEDTIAGAERRGIRTLKLDATDEGRPLYEGLGFVVEETVERWGRDLKAVEVAEDMSDASKEGIYGGSHVGAISEEHLALDMKAFGVSRKPLLETFFASGRSDSTAGGYVLSRPGRTAHSLGPCVASSREDAQQLIATHIGRVKCASDEPECSSSRTWYWDLLPANSEAVSLAEEYGFTRRRILWRMRRGDAIKNNDAMVYAIAGFELG